MPLEFKMKSIQIFWQNYITCKQGKTVTQKSQDNQPWWWESQEYSLYRCIIDINYKIFRYFI